MNQNEKWAQYIKDNGADFVHFVDAHALSASVCDGNSCAVLFGKVLSKEYINDLITGRKPKRQEFSSSERKMDALAVKLVERLESEGYKSVSKFKFGTLPHKTVALRAGLGFIGKNNLLVSEEYGCALVLGKVLTTAPFATVDYKVKDPQCGNCRVCAEVCPTNALHGTAWSMGITRDEMLIRKQCTCCLKCMIFCPYTRKYAET